MLKLMTAILISLSATGAWANDYPTIDIDGTTYYLADSQDSSDEWFETMDGYCVRTGQGQWGSGMGTVDDVGPLVRLDASGNVVATFPNYAGGDIWVVTSISCE